jgi:hypothetical protein
LHAVTEGDPDTAVLSPEQKPAQDEVQVMVSASTIKAANLKAENGDDEDAEGETDDGSGS